MFFFLLALFAAAATAAPVDQHEFIPVLRSDSVVGPNSFSYSYETGNGISAHSSGELKKVNSDSEAIIHTGQYRYTAPDGQVIEVNYGADENGFHPQGAHIPTPPPFPEHVQRALKYIEDHPQPVDPVRKF